MSSITKVKKEHAVFLKKSLHVNRILHSVLSDWWIVHLHLSIRSLEFRFVPSTYLIRSFELRIILSILSIKSERINCLIRENEFLIHEHEIPIPENELLIPEDGFPISEKELYDLKLRFTMSGFFLNLHFPSVFVRGKCKWKSLIGFF